MRKLAITSRARLGGGAYLASLPTMAAAARRTSEAAHENEIKHSLCLVVTVV